MFVLNPQSGTPIYRQIVNQTRRLITGGQLKAGHPMPSVRTLALEHAVNPMTISKAYAILEADGWLERNPGKPMTVALSSRIVDRRDRAEALKGQVREIVLAARQLELEPGEVTGLIEKYWKEFE